MRYPEKNEVFKAYIPEPTGQVINVTSADADLIKLMFGDHAEEVAEILKKHEDKDKV